MVWREGRVATGASEARQEEIHRTPAAAAAAASTHAAASGRSHALNGDGNISGRDIYMPGVIRLPQGLEIKTRPWPAKSGLTLSHPNYSTGSDICVCAYLRRWNWQVCSAKVFELIFQQGSMSFYNSL